MCGICGMVGGQPEEGLVRRAMARMEHRGPDQSGYWSDELVGLGHQRLAVIDLSEKGRQPMILGAPGRESVVVFNGEIYNFEELRRELASDESFHSGTDTEVLLHGFRRWGIDMLLERIRGMFAFALWDAETQELHLARDHCGKKPLYYSVANGRLYFASSIPALIELLPAAPAPSPVAIAEYLTQLAIGAPGSVLENVMKLPPAHRLYWSRKDVRLQRYWRIDYSIQVQCSLAEWNERMEAALKLAIRRRLTADVPLGAFLSGGVDSSLVVAMMAQCSAQAVRTISVGFNEERFNELPYARAVARHCGTEHHEFVVEPTAIGLLPHIVFACGEPFGDHSILPTYLVAREARKELTVVLTGDGGDEAFAGYETARIMAMPAAVRRLLGAVPETWRRRLQEHDRGGGSWLRKVRWLVEMNAGQPGRFDPIGARGFRGFSTDIFGPDLRPAWEALANDNRRTRLWNEARGRTDVDRMLEVEFIDQLPTHFLAKVDAATMAHSLEARSPFLDVEVVSLAARMPASVKMQWGVPKGFLKQLAARYVPHEAIYRRKQGFSVPVAGWFRGDLGKQAEILLLSPAALKRGWWREAGVRRLLEEHRHRRADHGHRLWLLLLLEVWALMFIDRQLQPNDTLD